MAAETESSPRLASKVMVIRHAEKPTDSPSFYGVTAVGEKDPESLIVRGWQRAGALACLFAPSRGPLQSPELAEPQFLFASDKKGGSQRPLETITPLSQKLGIKIDTSFAKGQEKDLVKKALSRQGIVLICWQHEVIPEIANRILGNETTAPQQWPGSRFDLVWVFDLDPGSGTYQFSQVSQLLLAGDSADPIA
jgi:hypothetical protein